MLIHENNYEVIQNPEGELLFGLKTREKEPSSPRIVYAGGEHAILYRNENETILLDFLPIQARQTIKGLDQVLIAEFDQKQDVVREYDVSVQHLAKLPISEANF